MNNTHIQWCDYSANVIKYRDEDGKSVWACVKVSDGCKNCYAEALAKRYGRGGLFTVGATAKVTPYFDEAEAKALLSSKRLPAGSKVFIGDMTDVFGPWVPDELLDRLFAVFALRPDVVFQVLTKRPERMREYLSDPDVRAKIDIHSAGYFAHDPVTDPQFVADFVASVKQDSSYNPPWPLANCWLGTSVEDQAAADKRIPELLATPAAVRFLSCEPLLSELHLEDYLSGSYEVSRGRGVSSSRDGRTDDRLGGSHLAGSSPSWQQMVGRDDDDPLHSPSGRESDWLGLSPSTRDDRLLTGSRAGASAGMAALQRADSSGADHQSQEREPIGQPTGELGTSNHVGAGFSQDPRPGLEARTQLSWVIVGGESGPGARPCDIGWLKSIAAQCRAAGVACFFKQVSGPRPGMPAGDPDLDGLKEFPR